MDGWRRRSESEGGEKGVFIPGDVREARLNSRLESTVNVRE
jgi:hypothetical protein